MASVIYLDKRKNLQKPFSLLDMIFDRRKREEIYDFYDNKYEETEEEKEILETMTKRRRRDE